MKKVILTTTLAFICFNVQAQTDKKTNAEKNIPQKKTTVQELQPAIEPFNTVVIDASKFPNGGYVQPVVQLNELSANSIVIDARQAPNTSLEQKSKMQQMPAKK
jgi:hypothetical protein